MKILMVNKYFHIKGGSETYIFSLKELLEANGHEIVEFSMHDPQNLASLYADYFVSNIDYNQSVGFLKKLQYAANIIYSREAYAKISQLIDLVKPDVAHLHLFQHQLSPSILYALKKKGIPIVYTAHDLKCLCANYKMLVNNRVCEDCKDGQHYNCWKNRCVKNSRLKSALNVIEMYVHEYFQSYQLIDVIITPSMFFRNKFIEYGFDANKIAYLPNFLDAGKFTPVYEYDNYFIYLGRLSEEKGVFTLLQAMHQVQGIQLYIIGTGPLEEPIAQKIKGQGLEARVKLLGYRSGGELDQLKAQAMFSVMPSEGYENAPYSLLEMMAIGKPVIGSNIGGIPEMIEAGNTGLLFNTKDADDLAAQINLMKNNPELVWKYGHNARDKLLAEYNSPGHYDGMEKIYKSLK